MDLTPEQCRALRLLADIHPSACPEWFMTYTHGFDAETILGLMRHGYASARRVKMLVGDHSDYVAHLSITEEGRWALKPLALIESRRITVNIAMLHGADGKWLRS
jgi:hypothetical protein